MKQPLSAGKLKLALLGCMASGAVLLGAWATLPHDSNLEIDRKLASLGGSSSAPADPLLFQPRAGQRYIYAFERRISFNGFGGLAIPPVAYHGEFFVDVLHASAQEFEAVLSERIAETNNQASPILRARIGTQGDKLALFTGELKGEEEQQHANIIRDLVSNWVFPLRSDTAGEFTARIESLPGGALGPLLKKVKLSYAGASGTNHPEVLSSLHFLQWNREISLPGELQGKETTRLGKSGSSLEADSRYHFRFRAIETIPIYSKATIKGLNSPSSLALNKKSMSSHPDYAKLDWSTILSALRGLDKMAAARQLDVFGDLLKFLGMHPEKIAEVLEMLRSPDVLGKGPDSPLFKTLVGALASLGTPEAQAALREIYAEAACAISCKGTILASLTTTQAPLDGATRDFLTSSMQTEKNPDLAHGAAFALGSALQNAPAGDPQITSAVNAILAAWSSQGQAGDMGEKLAWLDVMGNSGRSEFLPAIESVLAGTEDPTLRARAVFALRFIATESAALDLIRALADNAAQVRLAAANAIGFAAWNEAFRSPLTACGGSDASAQVRASCLAALAQNGGQVVAEN
jgi:hypothetical protein